MKKMIKVPFRGPIYPKGSIMGPITTPYLEDHSTIAAMLIQHLPVIEVLPTGGEVPLSLHNYDKDNTPVDLELSEEELSLLDETTITPPKINPSGTTGTEGGQTSPEAGDPNGKETLTPVNTGAQNQSNQQKNNQNQQQQQNRNQGQRSDDQNFKRK